MPAPRFCPWRRHAHVTASGTTRMGAQMLKVKKAVFPVAGLGTRFLPATKAIPKEMLPIVDKPLIQYAVEEAVAAGIDRDDLRHRPRQARDRGPLRQVATSSKPSCRRAASRSCSTRAQHHADVDVDCIYVRQAEPLGPRSRGAVRGAAGRRRAVRRDARRRPARRRGRPCSRRWSTRSMHYHSAR